MSDSSLPPSAAATVPKAPWLYRATFAVAAIVAAVLLVFFAIGIADGSVSSFNIVLWLGILSTAGAILFAGHALRTNGHPKAAVALLAVLAVPGISYALLVILFVVSGTRWN
jgi:hypothetical protein